MENECQNCSAPGGAPYCNEACRIADNPDDYPDYDDDPGPEQEATLA
jgi:hypothetical protein